MVECGLVCNIGGREELIPCQIIIQNAFTRRKGGSSRKRIRKKKKKKEKRRIFPNDKVRVCGYLVAKVEIDKDGDEM